MNSKQFAVVATITFFVGMVWLISDIIFNTKASIQISDKLQTLLEPVNPDFNSRVLEIIDKETMDRNEISVSVTIASPLPSPSLSSESESSPSGELNQ